MGLVFTGMEAGGGAFLAAVWIASAGWAARDAARRCGRPLRFVWTAIALLVPIAGAGLYLLARPCEARSDVAARRLRVRALEAMLEDDADRCGECAAPVRPEFRCCPSCGESLRNECAGCGRLVQKSWAACPWCERPAVEPALPETALPEVA